MIIWLLASRRINDTQESDVNSFSAPFDVKGDNVGKLGENFIWIR